MPRRWNRHPSTDFSSPAFARSSTRPRSSETGPGAANGGEITDRTGAVPAAPPSQRLGLDRRPGEAPGKDADGRQGDLLGTWNITAFTTHYQGSEGQFVGSGKELFAGCRDVDRSGACDTGEPKGTIRFTFIYWATLDPKTQSLVKGQCVHPVLGGTGAFAGVKGIIHMTDSPTPSGVRTRYTGTLRYGGATAASTSSLATRDLAGRGRREDVRRLSARRATPGVWEPLPAGPHTGWQRRTAAGREQPHRDGLPPRCAGGDRRSRLRW